jgi:hypothetical protein
MLMSIIFIVHVQYWIVPRLPPVIASAALNLGKTPVGSDGSTPVHFSICLDTDRNIQMEMRGRI